MAVVMRSYRNVSAQPLEIHEVGKEIKQRTRVDVGEISPLLRVSEDYHKFITEKTGFAVLMDEQVVEDDTPEGYVNITEFGDKRPRFRPMTPEEREQAGLPPLKKKASEPMPVIVSKPAPARAPVVAAPTPAPVVPATTPVVADKK